MTEDIIVAIIGTRDQTALMRLAGVEKYRIIEDEGDAIPEKGQGGLDGIGGRQFGRYYYDTGKLENICGRHDEISAREQAEFGYHDRVPLKGLRQKNRM